MTKKNIVIIGAGFGGATAALTIARDISKYADQYEILLIDRHHHQLYTPALYEIASIPASRAPENILKSSILISLDKIAARRPIRLVTDIFIGLRTSEKNILLEQAGRLPYEFVIFALGSETNYFNIPGLAEHSFPLKTYEDATRLRSAMEALTARKPFPRVVVGGGGASGVEIAAEFVNFFCAMNKDHGAKNPVCTGQITLVEAGTEILAGFDPRVITRAKKRLEKLGIAVRTGCRIQSVNESEISYQDNTMQPYDILVWTGGVKGPTVLEATGLPLSDKGALLTDERLIVANSSDSIFAIGDNAGILNPKTDRMVVWNVPAAQAEARTAARNVIAAIRGEKKERFIARKKYPFVLALGRKYAIADLGWIQPAGLAGWCLKQLIELRYLLFILPIAKAIPIWRMGIKMYTSND